MPYYGVGESFDHVRYGNDICRNFIAKAIQDDKDAGCICYDSPGTINHSCPVHKCTRPVKTKKPKKYCFITIQDFQRRMCDIDKLQLFLKNIGYMYESGEWIIESGKSKDEKNYNLHIHMLVKIKDSAKNHKQVMNIKWMKQFNTSLNDSDYYKMTQHRDCDSMPTYEDWLVEKRSYFVNDVNGKGGHVNTVDLELRGAWGA